MIKSTKRVRPGAKVRLVLKIGIGRMSSGVHGTVESAPDFLIGSALDEFIPAHAFRQSGAQGGNDRRVVVEEDWRQRKSEGCSRPSFEITKDAATAASPISTARRVLFILVPEARLPRHLRSQGATNFMLVRC